MRIRLSTALSVTGIVLAGFSGVASADLPKDKGPLRLIVGYQAGGSADTQARALAEPLSQRLGIPVIVENRSGAGGQIAAEYVKNADKNGLTVLFANMHMMVMLPLTAGQSPYDPTRDFRGVGRIVSFNEVIAINASFSADSLDDWLALAKQDAALRNYGVPAPGSVSQFIGYKLGNDVGVELTAVPYRGAAPAVQDLLGKQVAATITPISDVRSHYEAGSLKLLAINGAKRSDILPKVPTLKELGREGYDNLEWTGLMVADGVAASTITELNQALNDTLRQSEVVERLAALSSSPDPSTPEELDRLITEEFERWRPVVRASGFTTQ